MITVVIPVGPDKVYREYLQECISSVLSQTILPDELLLIDDMADIYNMPLTLGNYGDVDVRIHKNPWLCGVAHSFNFGVALAKNELVIMLGSDDKLRPWAVGDALKAWEQHEDPLGYYFFDIEYSDTGETQRAANNCAMVTKSLWKHTGGFPIQSVVGACDHIFLSQFMSNGMAEHIINIVSQKPPYWYRRHNESASFTSHIGQAVNAVKVYLSEHGQYPEWGRYE